MLEQENEVLQRVAAYLSQSMVAQPVTPADLEEACRANALFDARRDDPEFGYRFLVEEAEAAGQARAQRTAWRICSVNGWWSTFGKRPGKHGKKPGPPVHEDWLARTDEKGRIRHKFTTAAQARTRSD